MGQDGFFIPAGTFIAVKLLKQEYPISHRYVTTLITSFVLPGASITFPIFVPQESLIAKNVRELFSTNCVISHFYAACSHQ